MNYTRCEFESLHGKRCVLKDGHTGPHQKPDACPSCDSENITILTEVHTFQYGAGPDPVTLSATYPTGECNECEFCWADHRAEDARDAAVRKYRAEMETPV